MPAASRSGPLHVLACGDAGSVLGLLIERWVEPQPDLSDHLSDEAPWPGEDGGVFGRALLHPGLLAADARRPAQGWPARGFSTARRRYIVSELPAHAPCMRRLLALASAADVALLVVDAAQGLTAPVRRQASVLGLLGVQQWVLAVNTIDGSACDAATLERIDTEFRAHVAPLAALAITTVPVSGLEGDKPVQRSARAPWPGGPSLLEGLEACQPRSRGPRPPQAGQSELAQGAAADQFECTLVWLDDAPLLPGRRYTLLLGPHRVDASVTDIKHRLDADTLQATAARTLARDEIGVCKLALEAAVPFEPYATNPARGGFLLLDRNQPAAAAAAAGLLHFALRRSRNLTLQPLLVDKAARVALMGQQPLVLWFTGLSGAGKSSLANEVAVRLHARGCHTAQLDGDNLRHGLNRDLGFTAADRVENIRRVAEVARLMVDAGLIVLASFISPFRSERELARSRVAPGEFIEVYVDVPLEVAETRDTKGLYARARRGELPHFTGIGSPYEEPAAPEVHLRTDLLSLAEAADAVMQALHDRGLLAR